MAYIGTTPKDVRSFGKAKFDFTATASQTVFTGADDDGKTLGFTAGQISVYVNGILMDDSDFTVSNGNTVTLASPANAGDIISVVALQTDIPNSDYVPATGGTFSGDVAFQGAFTSRGIDDNATATAMTVDGSGNVLVGKTSANSNIAGVQAISDGRLFATVSNDHTLIGNRLSSDGAIATFQKDGTTVGSIGTFNSYPYFGKGDTTLMVVDALDAIYPRGSNGVSRNDAISLGDSGDRFKNLYLSGGVYLGGTGSANLLDDYEEGTFTPGITGWSGTYGKQDGVYTKIGNWVHCYGNVRTNGGTGTFTDTYPGLSGLPFTGGVSITGAMGYAHIVSGSTGIPSSKTSLLPLDGPGSGSSSVFPNWVSVGGDSSNFNNVYLTTGSNVEYRFMISYRTA